MTLKMGDMIIDESAAEYLYRKYSLSAESILN